MKKEEFIELGVSEELAKKCMELTEKEYKDYIPYTRFKEVVDEKNNLREVVSERDKQLDKLKTSTKDFDSLKEQIIKLQEENKEKEIKYKEDFTKLKVDSAIDIAITNAKGKNKKAIKALLDIENIKIDENGEVTGISKQIDKLIKTEDSSFLFGEKTVVKGVSPVASNIPNRGVTQDSFNNMSYKEKLELFNNNNELYTELSRNN